MSFFSCSKASGSITLLKDSVPENVLISKVYVEKIDKEN